MHAAYEHVGERVVWVVCEFVNSGIVVMVELKASNRTPEQPDAGIHERNCAVLFGAATLFPARSYAFNAVTV